MEAAKTRGEKSLREKQEKVSEQWVIGGSSLHLVYLKCGIHGLREPVA